MVYNFRIDRKNVELIMERINKEFQLSQGWGGGGEVGLSLLNDDFVQDVKTYHALKTTRIPTNLTSIKFFRDGDILIVPHLPENGKFIILEVDGNFPDCYVYNYKDDKWLNHRIKVKQYYGMKGNLDIHNLEVYKWYAKLAWMRLPVYDISHLHVVFDPLIKKLQATPDLEFAESATDEFMLSLKEDVIQGMLRKLGDVSPSNSAISFESVCENVFIKYGYSVKGKNLFDGKGSDTDLLLSYQLEGENSNPFINQKREIHVQIKKHSGLTDIEAVKQVAETTKNNDLKEGIVITLAEDFTEDAKDLASDTGVMLITGRQFCEIMLAKL